MATNKQSENDELVPDAQVRIELGGISIMTLHRRTQSDPDFPAQVKVHNRNFRSRRQLEAYKRGLIRKAMSEKKRRMALRQRLPSPETEPTEARRKATQ